LRINLRKTVIRIAVKQLPFILSGIILFSGCKARDGKVTETDREPIIEPDYSGVTIPRNIAPMNFVIKENGDVFHIKAVSGNGYAISLNSKNGIVCFPEKSWKKLLRECTDGRISIGVVSESKNGGSVRYHNVEMNVVDDPVDPVLCYRLLYPGYEAYLQIKIIQRSTESFWEKSLVENQLLKTNCINCHSFCQNDPDKFMVHVRGTVGGTYFDEGNRIVRRNLKTPEMKYGAVYPAWHPGGKIVAYSSNSIVQSFHASQEYNIEVTDLASSLVVYNIEKNEMSAVPEDDTVRYMETFPEWSPDGNYIYYCRARQTKDTSDFARIKYNLVRRSFDQPSFSFGKAEVLFNADSIDKSVSFPRISPDGRYLIFTLHNNGNFSIWHKEADLYLLNLENRKVSRMDVNSSETESYHSWSTNGKWIVFSSKRVDGLTARPYFSYFGPGEKTGKPFVLPQKDPTLYRKMVKTFNRPEFVKGIINFGPRDFEHASEKDAINAKWGGAVR